MHLGWRDFVKRIMSTTFLAERDICMSSMLERGFAWGAWQCNAFFVDRLISAGNYSSSICVAVSAGWYSPSRLRSGAHTGVRLHSHHRGWFTTPLNSWCVAVVRSAGRRTHRQQSQTNELLLSSDVHRLFFFYRKYEVAICILICNIIICSHRAMVIA